MKLILAAFTLLCIVPLSFAQPNNVVSAYMQLQENDLMEAKANIDAASEHDKTKTSAKTWYYRGKIYMAIYNDIGKSGKDYGITKDEALLTAASSYAQASELNTERIDKKQLDREYLITGDYMLNEGVVRYNEKEYAKSAVLFERTIKVKKAFSQTDSLAIYNAALAHEKAGNTEKAVTFYLECAKIKYQAPLAYRSAALLLNENGQAEVAMDILGTARMHYPDDEGLLITQINLFLANERYEDALFTIDQALVQIPNNADLHFSRGTLLENADLEEAKSSYKRAIEINPEHVNALYNLGAAYYNQAVDLRNAEGATETTGTKELIQSRKYLKKVEALSPGMEAVQNSLNTIDEILGE